MTGKKQPKGEFNIQGIRQGEATAQTLAATAQAIESMLTENPGTLTETDLWDVIAERHSGAWRQAKGDLTYTERRLRLLPDNVHVPLGANDAGLPGASDWAPEASDADIAEEEHRRALAAFTVINDSLRQKKELSGLLQDIVRNHRGLLSNIGAAKQAQGLTQNFNALQSLPKLDAAIALAQTAPGKPAAQKMTAGADRNIFALDMRGKKRETFNRTGEKMQRREKEKIPLTNTFWSVLNDGLRAYNMTMRKRQHVKRVEKRAEKDSKRNELTAQLFSGVAALIAASLF